MAINSSSFLYLVRFLSSNEQIMPASMFALLMQILVLWLTDSLLFACR